MDIDVDWVISFEGLYRAWRRFRRGKSRRADVVLFERDLESNLLCLWDDLSRGSYKHGTYQTFELHDSKRRRIDKATVRDRVVHEALFRYLSDVFEPTFIANSFSSRRKKGTLKALAKTDELLNVWRSGIPGWYAVIGDVKSFFASVPQETLLRLIARRVRDARLLAIIREIVGSFRTDGKSDRGMPLGNVTSQVFANIVMHELDRAVKIRLRLKRYVRYNDDVMAIVRGREQANRVADVFQETAGCLGLVMKIKTVSLDKRASFEWLGALYSTNGRDVRYSTAKRIRRAIRSGARAVAVRAITDNLFRSRIISYRAHISSYVTQN